MPTLKMAKKWSRNLKMDKDKWGLAHLHAYCIDTDFLELRMHFAVKCITLSKIRFTELKCFKQSRRKIHSTEIIYKVGDKSMSAPQTAIH